MRLLRNIERGWAESALLSGGEEAVVSYSARVCVAPVPFKKINHGFAFTVKMNLA